MICGNLFYFPSETGATSPPINSHSTGWLTRNPYVVMTMMMIKVAAHTRRVFKGDFDLWTRTFIWLFRNPNRPFELSNAWKQNCTLGSESNERSTHVAHNTRCMAIRFNSLSYGVRFLVPQQQLLLLLLQTNHPFMPTTRKHKSTSCGVLSKSSPYGCYVCYRSSGAHIFATHHRHVARRKKRVRHGNVYKDDLAKQSTSVRLS